MDQNHNNGHNLKISIQNNSGRADSVSAGKDRRFSHEKNQETEIGEKSGNSQDQNRSKQKGIERVSIDGKQKSRNGKNNVSSGAYQSSKSAGGNGRFKNPPKSVPLTTLLMTSRSCVGSASGTGMCAKRR